MTRRRRSDWRTVVTLPERPLSDAVLDLAAPMLSELGASPGLEESRTVLALAIAVWNAHVHASKFWGTPKPKVLQELRQASRAPGAPPRLAESVSRLSARWSAEHAFDPRLVGAWSYTADADGQRTLVCDVELPEGVEAKVPPPVEKRVKIGGAFLDEVGVPLGAGSTLSHPIEHHRWRVDERGVVTIWTKLPTAAQLFAVGHLTRIGGAPVRVTLGATDFDAVQLVALRLCDNYGRYDEVELEFRRADAP